MKKVFLLLISGLVFSGCATYKIQEAQTRVRSSFATHNFDKTVHLLEKYDRKNIYQSKDRVLYFLEMGTAMHFNARYDSSSHYFSLAEKQMNELFTKSISRGIASFLITNDNSLAYNGEAYEDVYLNAFKSLNYIQQNNFESALVEARRMSFKLSQIETKYRGLAQALSKTDTLHKGDWEPNSLAIQDSPFSHYLASVLYAKSGKPDDARIEYEKMLQAITNLPPKYQFNVNRKSLQQVKNPDEYNVLLVGFSGRAPIKYQNDIRLYIDEHDLYLKFSLPSLRLYPSRVARVDAVVNDSLRIPLQLIEQMDVVAKEVYKAKEPIIYARAFVRSLTKAIVTNAAEKSVKKEKKGLRFLVNIFGIAGQELSEKADTRGWQTMPGKTYVSTLNLPPGNHQVDIEYRDHRGTVLYTQKKELVISPNESLELLETLYWN